VFLFLELVVKDVVVVVAFVPCFKTGLLGWWAALVLTVVVLQWIFVIGSSGDTPVYRRISEICGSQRD